MHWGRWVGARARASGSLLLALLGLVAMAAAILAATTGLSTWIATSAARTVLENSPPGESGVQLQARAGDEPEAQDRLARQGLADGFAPASIDVWTTLVSEPVRVDGTRLVVWSGDHLRGDVVQVVDGTWPGAPDEAALQADAAERAGLLAGDALTVGGRTLTLTATWLPADPQDPRWHGDALPLGGADGQLLGPLVVSPDALRSLPGTPWLRWGVVPALADATQEQFTALADGAERAKSLVEPADATGRGTTTTGELGQTVRAAERDWTGARALSVVPIAILVLVTLVAISQVARVLTSVRERETRFLVARGATTRQLMLSSLVETLAVATVGAVLGAGTAAVGLRLRSGDWAQAPDAVTGGIAAAVMALFTLGVTTLLHARRVAANPHEDRRRVGMALAGGATLLLVGAAAVLTTWRLVGGSVLDLSGDAGAWDPSLLPSLAPAVLLAVAGLLGLLALAPIARLVESASRRASRSVTAWLAAAHLSRNLVLVAVPAVVTIMAVGAVTLAALFAGSSTDLHRNLRGLERGADVRTSLTPPLAATTAVPVLPNLADAGGVEATTPVWVDGSAALGDVGLFLVAAPGPLLADAASLPEGVDLPLAELGTAPPSGPIPVPAGTTTLTVRLGGQLSLDPWQQAVLELTPELHRREMEAPYIQGDAAAAARQLTTDTFRAYATPSAIRAEVVLREPATGLTHTVTGMELPVPGIQVQWDQASDAVAWQTSAATVTTEVTLPPDAQLVVDAVNLRLPGPLHPTAPQLTITIQTEADGTPLLGADGWTSDAALPAEQAEPYAAQRRSTPVVTEIVEVEGEGFAMPTIDSNRPATPPVLVAGPDGLQVTGDQPWLVAVRIGPGVAFAGEDPLAVAPAERAPASRVPVALTEAAAAAATLRPGDDFELIAFQRRIPATVAALTPAVPGTTSPRAALIDSAALGAELTGRGLALPWPNEIWARGSVRDLAAVEALPGVDSVRVAVDRPDTVGLTQQTFWTGAGGTLLLALAAIAATFTAQLTGRRGEVDVLRRLGVAGNSQGGSRALEHGAGVALSSLGGIAAGWAVGAVVVPPLVRAATGASPEMPVPLRAEVLPWAAQILCWWVLVAALLVAVARAVQRQATRPAEREVAP